MHVKPYTLNESPEEDKTTICKQQASSPLGGRNVCSLVLYRYTRVEEDVTYDAEYPDKTQMLLNNIQLNSEILPTH